jgi:endonuclease YncB( thermonuclease family)
MFTLGKSPAITLLSLLIFSVVYPSICAAKSIYGQVTDVKTADTMTLDSGAGGYAIRIAGIDVPTQEPFASEAKQFAANLVLGKKVRLRFISRAPNGEMLGRLDIDDPAMGIREVAVELVRAGLARPQQGFDGNLAAAKNEAREGRRGLWGAVPPK